jgi:xanthine dehydrogenase accessory factor
VVTLVEIFDARDTGAVRAFADGEAAGVFEAIAVIAPDGRIERSVVHPYPRLLPSGERGAAARSASRLSANSGVIPGAPQAREGDPGAGSKDGPAPAMNSGGGGAMAPGSPSRPAAPAAGDDTPQFASASSVPKATRWPHGLAPLFPLRERFGDERTPVLLFGAGHVGRALALALAPVPFRVRWVDTRPEAFPAHVPANAETVLTQDAPGEAVAAEAGALVMVMTHSHPLDLAIIDAALRRDDLGGVGLIGSATKRARFIGRLREAGLTEGQIARLTCPIGVPGIGGREPAVIAAAVAAQLLQWREAGAVRAGAPPAPRHRAGGQR